MYNSCEVMGILVGLDSKVIFERFEKACKEKHVSFYCVAKKSGVSCESIYKWRDRGTSPGLHLLEKICYVLEIDLVNLLHDKAVILNEEDKKMFDVFHSLTLTQKKVFIEIMMALKNAK